MISLDGGAGVGDFGVGGGVGGVGGLGVGGGVGTALWPLTDPLEECTWKGPAEVTQSRLLPLPALAECQFHPAQAGSERQSAQQSLDEFVTLESSRFEVEPIMPSLQ